MNLIRVMFHLRKCVHNKFAYARDALYDKVRNIIDLFCLEASKESGEEIDLSEVRRVCANLCYTVSAELPLRATRDIVKHCAYGQTDWYVQDRKRALKAVKALRRIQMSDAVFIATMLRLQAEMADFK